MYSKYWCFTVNNYTEEDLVQLRNMSHVLVPSVVTYLIYSYERGANGVQHVQGYVVFAGRKRVSTLKKMLPRAHWEQRRGPHSKARDYCQKVDDPTFVEGPFIFGTDEEVPEKSGSRTDLDQLKKDIDDHKPMEEIADNHFGTFLKFHRGIQLYASLKSKHRVYNEGEKPTIKIYWGPSGTGKSRRANEEYPNAYWLTKPTQNTTEVWWQDYSGQEVVIFDEFYSWIPYDLLLRILDWNQMSVPIKGGSVKLAAKTFIFTSNQDPFEWYAKVKDKHALYRRFREFGEIVEMTETFNQEIEVPPSVDQDLTQTLTPIYPFPN